MADKINQNLVKTAQLKASITKTTAAKEVKADLKVQNDLNALVQKFAEGGMKEADFRKEALKFGLSDEQIIVIKNQSEAQQKLKALLTDKSLPADIRKSLQVFADSPKGIEDIKAIMEAMIKSKTASAGEKKDAKKAASILGEMKGAIAKGDEKALAELVRDLEGVAGNQNGNSGTCYADGNPTRDIILFFVGFVKKWGIGTAGTILSPVDACGGPTNFQCGPSYKCTTYNSCRPQYGVEYVVCQPSYLGSTCLLQDPLPIVYNRCKGRRSN